MCGIAGFVGLVPGERLARAVDLLAHRGPDGVSFMTVRGDGQLDEWSDSLPATLPRGTVAGLGFRRLSILDRTEASDQPFVDEERQLAIVHNGEIYNFLELREELEAKGHRFRSDGDTEVLLAAYAEWGIECTQHLVGMWAFVIIDLARRRVLLSRDRFGIKPLYFSSTSEGLIFASEIKAVAALHHRSLGPDAGVIARFLVNGTADEGTSTFMRGVHKIEPGTTMIVDLISSGVRTVESYWTLESAPFAGSEADAVDTLRALFDRSVHEHLRSDVATGTCLSGGLDSSSIVCTVHQDRGGDRFRRPLLAFGYCSEDETVSEKSYMQAVSDETGVELVPIVLDGTDVDASIAAFLDHHDEPVGSASVFAQWAVFRRVKAEGVTVVLDGQGADEVFGGYHSYYAARIGDLLRTGHIGEALGLVRRYRAETGTRPPMGASTIAAMMPRVLRTRATTLRALSYRTFDRQRVSVLSRGLRPSYLARINRIRDDYTLRVRMRNDLLRHRLPSFLRYEDANSMAFSVEARVPFLDHRIVEFAATLPDDMLFRGPETKYILRRAMSGRVPAQVLDRHDKVGFRSTPRWTTDFVQAQLPDLISQQTEYERAWLDPLATETALRAAGDSPEAEFLAWRLANVILWLRRLN